MRRFLSSLSPFSGGLLLAVMFFIEYYTGVSNSVFYVLVVLVILWYSWETPFVTWAGIMASAFIVTGFFVIDNSTHPSILVNRVMAITTVWLSVIFVNRYKKLSENEDVQKRQLQALFDNATEGVIFTSSQGEIVRINPAAEKMFGYQTGELLGQRIEALVPDRFVKNHLGARKNLFQRPVNKPKGSGRELEAKCKSGKEFVAEISLSYFFDRQEVFYIAFIVDISDRKKQEAIIQANVNSIKRLNEALDAKVKQRTSELEVTLRKLELTNSRLTSEIAERKKAEEHLIKSKQLYTAIAKNFPEGVIGVLDKDLRYLLAEGKELQTIGFIHSNPVGERLFNDEDPEIIANAEEKMANVFHGESVSFDLDLKNNVYNLIAAPLPDAQNQIHEILVVMKNITERKIAERKLVRAIEKEKELSAMKSRFVTMASHEFRTPLSTMLSSVFLLQNYTGEKYEEQKKTHLDRIRRSIQTLSELMNDFLSIGQLEEGQIKTIYSAVEIRSFLCDTVIELNSIKKAGQAINVEFAGQEVRVMTDRQMLTNILRNLLSNAVKYSSADAPIFLRASVADGELTISVQDEGIGIPEQEQGDIFKRFYRAENAANIQGTGLGLNIVRKYVKLLKGNIDFKSKLNEGTTFTVRLPVKVVEKKNQFTP